MRKILISDFTTKEMPHGGSEWVNQVLIDKFNLEFMYSSEVTSFDKNNFYIISNVSLMNPMLVRQIPTLNYIIIENDYKICHSRHPWRWENSIIPMNERINYDLYEKAKAVFVQSTDHLNVYRANQVNGCFKNLNCSIWDDSDLQLLETVLKNNPNKIDKCAIYGTNNWIKNTPGAIKFCEDNNLEYELVTNKERRVDFLSDLAKYKRLVFLPIARETFCRLVVDAKSLGLEVITTRNYGAVLETWYDELSGQDMINFLRKQSQFNIKKISNYI